MDASTPEWEFTEALIALMELVRDRAQREAVVAQQTRVAVALVDVGEGIGTDLISAVAQAVGVTTDA